MMIVDDEDVMSISNKGKGKAVDTAAADDNLPWYFLLRKEGLLFRVEKYRPQSLDEVVSHQDIISTSI